MAHSKYNPHAHARHLWSWTVFLILVSAISSTALPLQENPGKQYIRIATRYLTYLSEGNYEAAVDMTDLQGLSDHLVKQRLTFLKKKNPDMTQDQLDIVTAELQANETSPENIRQVVMDMLTEANTKDMQWEIVRTATPNDFPQARVIAFKAILKDRETVSDFVVSRVGPNFFIAPHIHEQLKAKAPQQQGRPTALPVPIQEQADLFWRLWQTGALDQAYDMGSPQLKKALPLLTFLQTAETVLAQLGPLESWRLLSIRKIKPGYIRAMYELKCTKLTTKGVLDFAQTNGSWTLQTLVVPYLGEQ